MPLVIDLDGGVLPLPGEERLSFGTWQEQLRFGCSIKTLDTFANALGDVLGDRRPCFIGSGDYHHLSYLRLRRIAETRSRLRVVVFDNHPDNMRYPFGIHCGSWVAHAAKLPGVERIDVVGIASSDVEGWHALENHIAPLRTGKLGYWCLGRKLSTLRGLGATQVFSFATPAALLAAFVPSMSDDCPIYLSIDKDVLSRTTVRTNWDQGEFGIDDLSTAIALLTPRLIGCDVVGEISCHAYRNRFKRLLTRLDGQSVPPAATMQEWQRGQQVVNRLILDWLAAYHPR